jgi:hypothetical protein
MVSCISIVHLNLHTLDCSSVQRTHTCSGALMRSTAHNIPDMDNDARTLILAIILLAVAEDTNSLTCKFETTLKTCAAGRRHAMMQTMDWLRQRRTHWSSMRPHLDILAQHRQSLETVDLFLSHMHEILEPTAYIPGDSTELIDSRSCQIKLNTWPISMKKRQRCNAKLVAEMQSRTKHRSKRRDASSPYQRRSRDRESQLPNRCVTDWWTATGRKPRPNAGK